jgi:hypothetical protein
LVAVVTATAVEGGLLHPAPLTQVAAAVQVLMALVGLLLEQGVLVS